MRRFRWPTGYIALAVVLGLVAWSRIVQTQKLPEGQSGPSVAAKIAVNGSPEDIVGNERCSSCHKPELTEFGKTSHAHMEVMNKPAITCESCHGAGKPHADAEEAAHGDDSKTAAATKLIFAFRGSAKENAARCMTCHISSEQQDMFGHSEHAANGVACNECHATHLVNENKDQSKGRLTTAQASFFSVPELPDETRWLHNSLLKTAQPGLCYSCHATVQSEFAQPVHHRVPEGLMKCTDCHSPHGTQNQASLIKTQTETCTNCHVEKKGPFVYEHPAAKVAGCVSCHNPHGSTNRMLLVRREGRTLCLQCHTGYHTEAAVPHSRFGFQTSGECTRCHVTVHGSNFDANLLR